MFFRSGHATEYRDPGGQTIPVLPVYDTQIEDGVKESELHEAILRMPAGTKWVIFDGGGDSLIEMAKRHPGYTLYITASPGQMSYEIRVDGQPVGAFTYA